MEREIIEKRLQTLSTVLSKRAASCKELSRAAVSMMQATDYQMCEDNHKKLVNNLEELVLLSEKSSMIFDTDHSLALVAEKRKLGIM